MNTVLSIIFGLLTFTLPETKNKQIPTTIDQVIQEENENKKIKNFNKK